MKIKLVDDWRDVWRYSSARAAIALAAAAAASVLESARDQLWPLAQFAVPEKYWPWVALFFAVLIFVLRHIEILFVKPDAEAQEPLPASEQSALKNFAIQQALRLAEIRVSQENAEAVLRANHRADIEKND